MKAIDRVIVAILLLAANLSPSSSSSAAVATANYLRSHSHGIRNLESENTRENKFETETIAELRNEERILGPKKKGGGSSSSSGGSSGGGSSSSSSGSGGGGDGSGGDSTGSETTSRSESSINAAVSSSESTAPGFQWKDLNFAGTDRTAASVIVVTVGGVMCMSLLLFMVGIASYKILTSKRSKESSEGGILCLEINKAEQLVSASLD